MHNILKPTLMEESFIVLGGGTAPEKEVPKEIEMERQIYNTVQDFFASINGGFCEQTDDSDVTDGGFYQVLEFITTNDIFTARKNSGWQNSCLSLSIRYDNETKVIEDISFEASFFSSEVEDDSMEFTRRYNVSTPISDFTSSTNTTLKEHYEDFKENVAKFKKSMLYT